MKRFLSTWSVLLIVAVSSFVATSCSSDDDDDEVKVENKVGGKVPKVSEAVDLGLSVKWAPWNVGASQPTDYGEYFIWGEVTPGIDSEGYRYYGGGFNKEGKYNHDGGLEALEASDDAATANWGSSWRMPTYDEMWELHDEERTSWKWIEDYNGSGRSGYIIRSLKIGYEDAAIFLPAAGYYGGTRSQKWATDWEGAYWLSDLNSSGFNGRVWGFHLDYQGSHCGLPVRAVCP